MEMELRPGTGDLFGFFEIVLRGDYFSGGQRIEHGQTVIDIGANIGCFTVTAARRVGPSGHVLAIEPEESTFLQLQRNIELNQLRNVTALRLAVGSSEGEIVLHGDPNRLFSSIYSTVNGRAIGGAAQRVPVTTLGNLLATYGISRCHYLKLDCEGAEHDIVASMSSEVAERVEAITMEVHKVPGHDGTTLGRSLEALGYKRVGSSTLPFYTIARRELSLVDQ
jgi:FkbM family methyltransferase